MEITKDLKTISCINYCKEKNMKYISIYPEREEKAYYPIFNDDGGILEYKNVIHPEIYLAELNDVNILGNSNVVFDDEYCIYDLVFHNSDKRYFFNVPTTYVKYDKSTLQYTESNTIIEKGIMLSLCTIMNITHFLGEMIPKLYMIENSGLYKNYPIIVDENIMRMRSFNDILNLFNKNNREIIYVEPGKSYKVKNLIFPSSITIFPHHYNEGAVIKYEDILMNSDVINGMHEVLHIQGKQSKRIYISRGIATRPRVLNELEVEKIFKEFGYEILYSEMWTLEEKRKIISDAKYMAVAYGSGATNALFASRDINVIYIQPETLKDSFCYNFFGVLGEKTVPVDAKAEIQYNHACAFTVDIEYLRRVLTKIHSQDN